MTNIKTKDLICSECKKCKELKSIFEMYFEIVTLKQKYYLCFNCEKQEYHKLWKWRKK